jgi:hypothetical protein
MKAKVAKEEFLKGAKAEIDKCFGTRVEAAKYFGVEPSHLCNALKGAVSVPGFLLRFMGYKKEQIYIRDRSDT